MTAAPAAAANAGNEHDEHAVPSNGMKTPHTIVGITQIAVHQRSLKHAISYLLSSGHYSIVRGFQYDECNSNTYPGLHEKAIYPLLNDRTLHPPSLLPHYLHPTATTSLGYPPQAGRNGGGVLPSKVISGGVGEAARMFALVVSLAHVHNVSGPHVAADKHGGESAAGSSVAPSQLQVALGGGGREAIVTACGK